MLTSFLMESGFGESLSKFSEIFKDFAQFLFYLQCKKGFGEQIVCRASWICSNCNGEVFVYPFR